MSQPGYEIDRDKITGATKREREVLILMAEGLTFTEVGTRLGVSKQRAGQIAQALVKKGLLIHSLSGYGLPLSTLRKKQPDPVNS